MSMVRILIPAFVGCKAFGIGGRSVALDADGVAEVTAEEAEILSERFANVSVFSDTGPPQPETQPVGAQPETGVLDLSEWGEDQLRAFAKEADIEIPDGLSLEEMQAFVSDAVGEIDLAQTGEVIGETVQADGEQVDALPTDGEQVDALPAETEKPTQTAEPKTEPKRRARK